MSQMPRLPRLAACPTCEEPLESGDNFCGVCGADLASAPPIPPVPPAPEVAVGHPAPPMSGAARGRREEPEDYPLPAPAPAARADPPGPPAPPAGAARPDPPGPPAPPAGAVWDAPPAPAAPPPPAAPYADAPDTAAAGAAGADPRAAAELGAPGAQTTPDTPGMPGIPTNSDTNSGGGAHPRPTGGGGRRCAACQEGTIDQDGYCDSCGHAQPRDRDHMERELAGVAAASDRGLRHHRNEDAFAVSAAALPDGSPAVLAVVCDGVSSATRPDDASAAAAHAAGRSLLASLPRGTHPQQAMTEAIVAASEAVNSLAAETGGAGPHDDPHQRQQNAPACTIVSAVVTSGILTVGWIGDSRAYWVPDDRSAPPARLTEDDSWAAQMVAAGLMSEAEAYADERAHAITGWLGADAYELDPHTASFKPDRPGVVVVCTDGLWNYAESAQEMARAVPPDARARPMHSARALVGHALEGGGHDNVTVAVLPFPAEPGRAGSG
ncbi:protein phosphatase 2C domain-containing protein [Streptomyces sparsogenes]|uniref:PP2C family serine/threonine-protein phosphatase n=1 Tax=Streptomyces sparsogenes TaxID=67365 RepID=UPI0033F2B633